MKGFKLILSLLLMLSLLVMTVAGCSGSKETSDSGSGSSETAENDGSEEEGSSQEGGSQNVSTEEKHHFTAMVGESDNQYLKFADREKYVPWQELMKLFDAKGLEVEWDIVQQDQYATTLATTLASDDLPEYINLDGASDATLVSCIENGTLVAVNDFIENGDGTAKEFLERYPQVYKKASYTDGKMYWIPALQETYYDGQLASTCTNMLIRKDWVDALGIEVPDTLDGFTDYLKACQANDMNGNGIVDEYLGVTPSDFGSGLPQWFGISNSQFGLTGDGELLNSWKSDGVKDYFKYIIQLVDEGLISPDYIADDGTIIDTANANNQCAALSSYAMQGWLEPEIIVQEGAADPLYVTMMPIEAVDGIEPFSNVEPPQLTDWRHSGFTKALQDQEAASIFLDIFYSDEYATLSAWGVEGVTFEVRDGINVLIGDALNADWEAASISGKTTGDPFWRHALPQIRFSPMENELMTINEEKAAAQVAVIDYPHVCYDNISAYMAVPTTDEMEVLDKYLTDFRSLSGEIGVQIIKGEIDIDTEWDDKVIAPLEEAGMSEIESVYAARVSRYYGE